MIGIGQCSSFGMPPHMVAFEVPSRPDVTVQSHVLTLDHDTDRKSISSFLPQRIWKLSPCTLSEKWRCRRFDLGHQFQAAFPEYISAPIVLDVLLVDKDIALQTGLEAKYLETGLNTKENISSNSPLIVIAHGGPHSAYASEWSRTYDHLLSEGYMLLFGLAC